LGHVRWNLKLSGALRARAGHGVNLIDPSLGNGAEGRRHARYQLRDLTVATENGLPLRGTGFEIGAGGMAP
jgi:hypothetical protein